METTADLKAEKRRRQQLADAENKWRAAAKRLGLNNTARNSGLRAIQAAKMPGRTCNALIREYQGRSGQALETAPMADLSEIQELRAKLIRRDGALGFPSDPRVQMFYKLERKVIDGMPLASSAKEPR